MQNILITEYISASNLVELIGSFRSTVVLNYLKCLRLLLVQQIYLFLTLFITTERIARLQITKSGMSARLSKV